jgi:hypothetical protein
MLFDDDNAPTGCFEYFAQVSASDYESFDCGPGYVYRDKFCLLSCASASDCRPTYETCGDAGTCIAATRTR